MKILSQPLLGHAVSGQRPCETCTGLVSISPMYVAALILRPYEKQSSMKINHCYTSTGIIKNNVSLIYMTMFISMQRLLLFSLFIQPSFKKLSPSHCS